MRRLAYGLLVALLIEALAVLAVLSALAIMED